MSQVSCFWGPVTSTIDWCEPNYKITSFIAEPANTFSNLSFVILGLIGALHESTQAQAHQSKKAYAILYTTVAFIGVGSMLFHGTLRIWGQQMDELPMVWYLLMCMYVVNHDYIGGNPTIKSLSNILLPLYAIVFSILHLILKTTTVFQIHFGVMVSVVLLRMHQRFRDVDVGPQGRKVIQLFFATGLSGFACWLLDYHFCHAFFVQQPKSRNMSSSSGNVISNSLPSKLISKPWRILESLSTSSFSMYPIGHMLWHLLMGYCAFCFVTMLKILESHQIGKHNSLTVFYKYGIIPLSSTYNNTTVSSNTFATTIDYNDGNGSDSSNSLRLNISGGSCSSYDRDSDNAYASGSIYSSNSYKNSCSTSTSTKSCKAATYTTNSGIDSSFSSNNKDLEMF